MAELSKPNGKDVPPLVSVVLPTFNRAHTLPGAVQSVLMQSCRDLELIVVDDGSTDGTSELICNWPDERVFYLRLEQNGGVAAARNAGVAIAQGRYLAFQDSDDEWLLDKLQIQLDMITTEGAECRLVMCGILRFGKLAINLLHAQQFNGRDYLEYDDVFDAHCSYTQTWLVDRELLQQTGAFDPHLRVWEDWESLMRLAPHTRIRMVDKALVVSGKSDDSLSVGKKQWCDALRYIIEKHSEAIKAKPASHAKLNYLLARLYVSAGNPSAARRHCWEAIKAFPVGIKHWVLFGVSFFPPLARWLIRA